MRDLSFIICDIRVQFCHVLRISVYQIEKYLVFVNHRSYFKLNEIQ